MESHGVPNMIHLTKDTAELIKSRYELTSHGPIEVKGKGVMETIFNGRVASSLILIRM